MSRVLEEGMASNLMDALEQPVDLALTVMRMRAFIRTKDAIDAAQSEDEMPSGELADLVWELRTEQSRRIREQRNG